MAKTLEEILYDVNSFVDLEYALPEGTDLETRSNYANQAVWEASAIAQLNEFTRLYEVDPGTSSAVTLPANFKEFKINPKQQNGSVWTDFEEVAPEEKYNKSSGEYYCYVLGNPASNYVVHFNNLAANATVSILYQSYPSGMATLSDKCELSDPMYVVNKVESIVLQSRGDDRFPYVDNEAKLKLRNLVGRGSKSPGGQYRTAPAGTKNPLR